MEFIFFLQAKSRSVNCSNLAKMVLFIEETSPCILTTGFFPSAFHMGGSLTLQFLQKKDTSYFPCKLQCLDTICFDNTVDFDKLPSGKLT